MERIVNKSKFLSDLTAQGIGYLTCPRDGYNIYLSRPKDNLVLEMTDYGKDQLVLCALIG